MKLVNPSKFTQFFINSFIMLVLVWVIWLTILPVLSYAKNSDNEVKVIQINEEKKQTIKHILYINSYHDGYKWSDDIMKTLEAAFVIAPMEIMMDTIYLDTQRIGNIGLNVYYKTLSQSLKERYKNREIDLIITSDDAAYDFVKEYGDFFNQDIPIIFSGVNDMEKIKDNSWRQQSGIIEFLGIGETIDLIKSNHQEIKKIYYITDDTLTGSIIEQNILDQLSILKSPLIAERIKGKNMAEMLGEIASLEDGSVILFAIYFYDEEGNYFSYDEAISLMSETSKVPIYGLWEFSLGHGIVGGKLLSGIEQGKTVAEQAIEYFNTGIFNFPVITTNTNNFKFDYNQLLRFNIPIESLPIDSDIINYSSTAKKNVLVIHSYNSGFAWTESINDGIKESFSLYDGNYEIYTEFIDLKRKDNISYLNEYKKVFLEKHEARQFDLIITSDDGAYNFFRSYLPTTYQSIPLVFCGMNNYETMTKVDRKLVTGIMESYNIEGTLDLIEVMQPEVKEIYVINDETLTGIANRQNLEKIIPKYEGIFKFNQKSQMSMPNLLEEVGTLNKDVAILLLSFNKDYSNNSFSYEESIKLIYGQSSVPIYSVWDFYLDQGIVGGYLTNGNVQGKTAGEMGVQILNGISPENINIIMNSPNDYMFDMNILRKFNIKTKSIPNGAIVINKSRSLIELYKDNQDLFLIIIITFIIAIILIGILFYFLRDSIRKTKHISRLATIDHLTGILNRGSGIKQLMDIVKNPKNYKKRVTICYMDINNLKYVNDHYGHGEGDKFIIATVSIIKELLSENDIFCRMGGDEFMTVFMSKGDHELLEFEKNLQERLAKKTKSEEVKYSFSVSLGINSFIIKPDTNISQIIEVADKKMYENKMKYRNKN